MTTYLDSRAPRPMPMDLYRDADQYVLTADLPGIDPTTVDVDLDGRMLSVRAERAATSGDDITWIRRERQAGSFVRRLTLGQGVDADSISASYENGVLRVTIPVAEKAKARKIQVATAA